MKPERKEIPDKRDAIDIIALLAIEIASDVNLSARRGREWEAMSVAIFEEHMRSIAPEYKYQPCLYHVFDRNSRRELIFHKGLFYLWFKKNLETFKKLSGVPVEFKKAIESFENLNSYMYKHEEMVKGRNNDLGMTTDDIIKESDLLWAEYKAQQLALFQ